MRVRRGLGVALLTGACLTPTSSYAQATEPEPTFLTPALGPDRSGGPAPTSEARAALREMEHELDAFTARAGAYRRTVTDLGRRELDRRRRDLEIDYQGRIGVERSLETAARDHAIALMERFIADHPDDETATPDAMLRLGELQAERSMASLDGDRGPDYADTIATYRGLIERFPSYARRGSALYVLGYCLDREGRMEEAVAIWRRALCSGSGGGTSDYASCTPVENESALTAEMWLRLGGYEFDALDPGATDRAIVAYRRAIVGATPRVRSLALYMLAWAHYRDGAYVDAIARFTELVDESDRGHAGAALRSEAIDYVAISLADRDWNTDSVDDVPSPLARATDPALLAQDRPWTTEVMLALGRVAFDEGHYDDSVLVLEEMVRRWPMDPRVPAAIVRIARAKDRLGDDVGAQAARVSLAAYDASSTWARHNEAAHPREVAEADRLARTYASMAVLGEAIRCHERARSLRGSGETTAASESYACAVQGYRTFLTTHANDPESYGVSLDLADALFWSGRYEDAAHAYEDVRDSPLDDDQEVTAARAAVEAYRRAMEAAGVTIPSTPSSEIVAVPPLVASMARARETYLTRIAAARDHDHLRGAYAVNQALLLDAYGYTAHARARLDALFARSGCGDDGASAYRALRGIVLRADGDDVAAPTLERLATEYAARSCTTNTASSCDEDACAADALCTARCDLTAIAYRRGLDAYHRAAAAEGDARRQLYEQAASVLLAEIDRAPDHPDVPSALLVVGDALDQAGHDEAASHVYERAIDQLAPQHPASPERRAAIDRALALSWLRLGRSAMRVFDDERATRAFGVLARSERFAGTSDATVVDARADAWAGLAEVEARSAEYASAAESYAHIASAPSSSPEDQRIASFQAAEMRYRAHDWSNAAEALRAFTTRWTDDPDRTALAYARLGEVEHARHRRTEERAALHAVIDAAERTLAAPGSPTAALAAHAALQLADEQAASFATFAIDPGSPATVPAYVAAVHAQLEAGAARAQAARAAYDDVAGYGDAPSTLAALVAQAGIDERLARGTLETPIVLPRDLSRALRRASPDVREESEARFSTSIATQLDAAVRPIECRAIARYLLAARLARRAVIDDPSAQRALDRLATYGDDRITECADEARAQDPSFAPYAPGEIARVPRGIDTDAALPAAPLAP